MSKFGTVDSELGGLILIGMTLAESRVGCRLDGGWSGCGCWDLFRRKWIGSRHSGLYLGLDFRVW